MPRSDFPSAYRFALRMLMAGCALLGVWLLVLIVNALTALALPMADLLLDVGALLAVTGILIGAVLDYLALRRHQMA